jgi:deazaflavin-dependent oxidoreductase (nitroreductase family)
MDDRRRENSRRERTAMSETRLPPYTPSQERFASAAVKLMTRLNVWIYRLSDGRVWGKFLRGAPVCLMTTTGRRSGAPRTVALLYLEDGADMIVVGSKGGMSKDPLWVGNLAANPDVEIQIRGSRRAMRAQRVPDEEKAALWPRLTAMYPDFDEYQGRTTRNIPVFRLTPR